MLVTLEEIEDVLNVLVSSVVTKDLKNQGQAHRVILDKGE